MIGIDREWALLLLALFGLGSAFNAFVASVGEQRHRGFTSFLVVVGVTFTLAGYAMIAGWQQAAEVMLCFVASGLPMIGGSVWRYIRERERQERQAWHEAREMHRHGTP